MMIFRPSLILKIIKVGFFFFFWDYNNLFVIWIFFNHAFNFLALMCIINV